MEVIVMLWSLGRMRLMICRRGERGESRERWQGGAGMIGMEGRLWHISCVTAVVTVTVIWSGCCSLFVLYDEYEYLFFSPSFPNVRCDSQVNGIQHTVEARRGEAILVVDGMRGWFFWTDLKDGWARSFPHQHKYAWMSGWLVSRKVEGCTRGRLFWFVLLLHEIDMPGWEGESLFAAMNHVFHHCSMQQRRICIMYVRRHNTCVHNEWIGVYDPYI